MLSARTGLSPIYNPMVTTRGAGRPPVAQRNKENIAPNVYERVYEPELKEFNVPNRTVSSARLGDSARIMDSTSGAPGARFWYLLVMKCLENLGNRVETE